MLLVLARAKDILKRFLLAGGERKEYLSLRSASGVSESTEYSQKFLLAKREERIFKCLRNASGVSESTRHEKNIPKYFRIFRKWGVRVVKQRSRTLRDGKVLDKRARHDTN